MFVLFLPINLLSPKKQRSKPFALWFVWVIFTIVLSPHCWDWLIRFWKHVIYSRGFRSNKKKVCSKHFIPLQVLWSLIYIGFRAIDGDFRVSILTCVYIHVYAWILMEEEDEVHGFLFCILTSFRLRE